MHDERFTAACAAAAARIKTIEGGIGTYGEKGIHSALKHYFEPDESRHEVRVGGYIADALGENGIIEIQTRGFSGMKEKLAAFLECTHVTVVYPCVVNKRIIVINKEGELLYKRKSPRSGNIYDIIPELWGIADLLDSERLDICIMMLEADEYREKLPEPVKQRRRRRPVSFEKLDNIPTALVGEIWLRSAADYRVFIPEGLPEVFTSADCRRLTGLQSIDASSVLRLLLKLGLIERMGKKGNAYLYKLKDI